MKKQACFQNPNNPINLVLVNIPPSFQSSSVIETGLLNFHWITVTVMRVRFKRLQPKSTTETTKDLAIMFLENIYPVFKPG